MTRGLKIEKFCQNWFSRTGKLYILPRTDRTLLYFSGRYVRDSMCNSVLFSTTSDQISYNLYRKIGPRNRFFECFSGYIVSGLFSKISSKNWFRATFVSFNFYFLTILGVSFNESLKDGEQKLDFFRKISGALLLNILNFSKKTFLNLFWSLFIKDYLKLTRFNC